ncbi:DUF2268 domain-containing protein [Planococcus ruber]|uniref:DUF2268 domain-containing protein n=1 Tax=Planococcus ruber TaxID=2027871 RepID=UPI001FEE7336|nr:DUF2268 domain-containing putative Zn-dependent protease [Planococcus ruber]MCJ1909205.1 DUF2268 domain-containing protein [Planococcus ruber]
MANFKVAALVFLILISLTGCSEKNEEIEKQEVEPSFSFEQKEQEFTVVNYLPAMEEFIKAAEENPDNKDELYKKIVHGSLRDHGLGYSILEEWIFAVPFDLAKLEASVTELTEQKEQYEEAIKEALVLSADLLPGENKTIHVFPALPEFARSMEEVDYVAGFVWEKGDMVLLLDPRFNEDSLKQTVAHEYHHMVYEEKQNNVLFTVAERTVMEGKADVFAKIIYPDQIPPWASFSSEYEKANAIENFKAFNQSADPEIIIEFHNGNPVKQIPQWAHYKIGNDMVQTYLSEHPEMSIPEWTALETEAFLKNSGYQDAEQ